MNSVKTRSFFWKLLWVIGSFLFFAEFSSLNAQIHTVGDALIITSSEVYVDGEPLQPGEETQPAEPQHLKKIVATEKDYPKERHTDLSETASKISNELARAEREKKSTRLSLFPVKPTTWYSKNHGQSDVAVVVEHFQVRALAIPLEVPSVTELPFQETQKITEATGLDKLPFYLSAYAVRPPPGFRNKQEAKTRV